MEEIPPEVQKGVRAALGERFRHGLVKTVQVETKGEKTDNKILALKNCRAFILSSKSPPKLEHEFNYLELEQIESTKPKQVKLKLQDRKDPFVVTADSQEEVSKIIEFIAESLKRVFPHTPLELFFDVKLEPSDRLDALQNHLDCFSLPDLGPCGGFSQMYHFMCDLHGLPYMEEVAWDIDTIYLSQDSSELCLNDFDHLEAKDLVPILSSLTYNNWFKRLTVRDIRLGVEATKEVINIVRRSSSLEQLVLHNTGFKSDFAKELAAALQANSNSALILLDLANNHLDDRGLKSLCPALAKLQNGLVELSLPNTGVTPEGVSALGKALSENNFFPTSLMRLNLSGNVLKDGNIELLLNFLAQPNHLTHLDLSDCGIPLDSIFSALFRGCINLTNVNLSGNVYTYKKGKDVTVPQAVKQFFATTTKLQSLNIANCKLFPDAIKEIMLGIGSNRSLENVEVNLHSNELRHEGAKVIASCIANVPNITSLNLSNNDFSVDLGSLMAWISQNKVLAHLDISENFVNVRQKNLQAILDSIVDVIQTETSPIRSLSIARNKLKFETIPIINALGSNTTLTCIDISGNHMGDIGARMLAKALQINCKLETIMLDNNSISPKGFQDIANALERNYSLKSIPPPVADLTSCSKSGGPSWEKAETAFKRIQVLLQRNHSPQKFADAQAFRLQQGFLYTTSHQLVDKLVVQIQDACKELADCEKGDVQENIQIATGFIKDADNSKQLLEVLHEESRKSESDDVTLQLKEMANQIHNSVEGKLKKTAEGMINGTKEKCPHVMENQELEESVKAVCKNRSTIPDKFVLSLIEQLNAQLCNQMSEANLAMAAHISDTIIDEIIDKLMNSHQKLGKHLSTYRNRTLSLSLTDINGPKSQDEVDHAEQGLETTDSLDSQQFQKKEGQSTSSTSKDNLRDKRKSVKLRPKSVMVHAQDVIQPPPPAEPAPKQAAASAAPTPPKKEPAKKSSARAAPNVDLGDFDAISSSSERPLRDARLDRPRRVRNVRPTRAVAVPQKDNNPGQGSSQEAGGIQDVSEGVDNFFRPVDPELVTPVTQKSKSDTPSKDKKKKEKEDKDKKKKQKDEGKKKKEEKKKGFLGGIFAKRRSSQPNENKESSSVKRGSDPPTKAAPEKGKQSPPQGLKLGDVVEEDSEPPTPEYRSSEDELSSKDEDSKSSDAVEKREEAAEPAPKPVKVALKPIPSKALKPNVLADLKASHAKRKSKEIVDAPDGTPNGEVPDPPKNEDKPPPPVKPVTSPRTNGTSKSPEETKTPEPVEKPEDTKQEEEPKDQEEKPAEEEDVAVPEKTESPKKTLPGGLLVLPPSPVKSNGSARNSIKSETSEGDEESETTLNSEIAKSPTLHETHEMPSSTATAPALAPNDQKDDVAPEEGDIPFPEVLPPKPETAPSEQSLQSPDNSLTQEAGASSPAKPSSPSSPNPSTLTQTDGASPVVDEPPAKLSSPTEASKKILPPIQMEPSTKPPSPTRSLSPKSLSSPPPSLDSKPPASPTKAVNPLFIPKKSNSVQEKPSAGPPSSPKKSASIGARPGNRATAEDKTKEVKSLEGKTEPSVTNKEEANVNGDIKDTPGERVQESEKEQAPTVTETNGKTEKKDEPKSNEKENDKVSPKRPLSISDRMKNFQNPQAEKEEPSLSINEKRKSFEQKQGPPVAAPRPKSITPKPAPRPKPPLAKRPVSADKTASQLKSPPGPVVKKAPPVAGRRLLPK